MMDPGLVSSKGRSEAPRRDHWDDRYRTAGSKAVSWYQVRPVASLQLLATAGLNGSASLIDVGGGAGTLVDALLHDGWSDLTVLDVSDVALAMARDRVGTGTSVQWIVHDLLTWQPSRGYEVWHDRAVFHFLVEEEDRSRYRQVLRKALAPSGTVVVGTFASDGPTHCSGLPVARYDEAELVAALGGDFDLLATTREEHLTPAGTVQPFTWVALRTR
jgi:trans-aconitate methyltransferase